MGRRIPNGNLSSSLILHPVLYLSFLAAGVAASIAIVTALCIGLFWRKSSPSLSDSPERSKKNSDASCSPSPAESTSTAKPDPPKDDSTATSEMKELPLPPALQAPKDVSFPPAHVKRAASERRLSFNLSVKMPRTLSVARRRDPPKEDTIKKIKKAKPEDNVWMKTIILGEKCQVPDDQEDAVIYEGKGKKVSAYHPKTKSTPSCSHFSFVDPGDLQTQNQAENLNKTWLFHRVIL